MLQDITYREKCPPGSVRDCQDREGLVSAESQKDHRADRSEFHEIQELFNVIKSSVDKVILPPQLKLYYSRSVIKREDQPVFNVVSKCGRYIKNVGWLFWA